MPAKTLKLAKAAYTHGNRMQCAGKHAQPVMVLMGSWRRSDNECRDCRRARIHADHKAARIAKRHANA